MTDYVCDLKTEIMFVLYYFVLVYPYLSTCVA